MTTLGVEHARKEKEPREKYSVSPSRWRMGAGALPFLRALPGMSRAPKCSVYGSFMLVPLRIGFRILALFVRVMIFVDDVLCSLRVLSLFFALVFCFLLFAWELKAGQQPNRNIHPDARKRRSST